VKLYPFQLEVVDRFEGVPHVLIGDDMGLGKTVEALALDCRRRAKQLAGQRQSNHKTLIIAPLSVISSWQHHVQLVWPASRCIAINPKNRDEFVAALKGPYHYYIIHWEALRLVKELQDVHWWHVIADEVHKAKNRKSLQTIALKKIRTYHKTALSGTPADNSPQDIWSILHWLYPRTFTSYWTFYKYHVMVKVETNRRGQQYKKICGVAHADELLRVISPFYARRLKEDVIKDLPDKYYSTIEVTLSPAQRRIYNQMKSDMLSWVGKHEDEPIAAPIILAQLTRLKQFALACAELVEVRRYDKKAGETQTTTAVRLTEPSSKLDAAMEIITETTEKVVVFSESKQIINLLVQRLVSKGISNVVLTGDTPAQTRGQLIDTFQNGGARVFAGTISAGGIGITLTSASTVIFLDRMWNPSQNRQAEDRLHRIGQENAVHVIDIVASDTVDGGRLQQIRMKWEWLKELLGDKPSPTIYQEAP
jgi:SNF2 family DNA or RNA helicase